MSLCNLCPRNCNIDRRLTTGICKVPEELSVSKVSLHLWEEPFLSGEKGSGTVFFNGCNLGCVYCQNGEISRNIIQGKTITIERLKEIFLEQQNRGAHNINLVTPSHYVTSIKKALILAKEEGLSIPVIYNTSSYDKVSSLNALNGLVDVYLADFKYSDKELAKTYSKAEDYPQIAKLAFMEMYSQVGKPKFKNDLMVKGLVARILILPGQTLDAKMTLTYLFNTYKNNIFYSIMNQYTPVKSLDKEKYPELNRSITQEEYEDVLNYTENLGIENAFIQEGGAVSESFIPKWDQENV